MTLRRAEPRKCISDQIPITPPLSNIIDQLHDRYRGNFEGRIADYIPELGKADPCQFGIALVTADGYGYEAGESDQFFTAQSVSKPFAYALALEDHGLSQVQTKIGVEPTGDPFNALTFDEPNSRAFNPMINGGAITAVSLIAGNTPAVRFERIIETFTRFTGRRPVLDEAVYRSERATAHRNRAIAYLGHNHGIIQGDVEEHLDLYFRQCSLRVTALDLAIAGATLANDGINPITAERALSSEHVRAMLSVMRSCGMYDYSGRWDFNVGFPAKSGVSGGILAVIPGAFGLGVFSPLVDTIGNSVRGVKVCEDLSRDLGLHTLKPRRPSHGSAPIKDPFDNPKALDPGDIAAGIKILDLVGSVSLPEAEIMTRRLIGQCEAASILIIDLTRAFHIDEPALNLLIALQTSLERCGKTLLLAGKIAMVAGSCEERSSSSHWYESVDSALRALAGERGNCQTNLRTVAN